MSLLSVNNNLQVTFQLWLSLHYVNVKSCQNKKLFQPSSGRAVQIVRQTWFFQNFVISNDTKIKIQFLLLIYVCSFNISLITVLKYFAFLMTWLLSAKETYVTCPVVQNFWACPLNSIECPAKQKFELKLKLK